jgi:signal transduction histidine kinase
MERPRVLIIDGDEVGRVAIRRALEGLEAEVTELPDGREAVARLAMRRCDCIVLGEPRVDAAVALVQAIRAAGHHVPIVYVTAQDGAPDEEIGETVLGAGASDYLPRCDLSPKRLGRRVRYAVRLGRAEAQTRDLLAELAEERALLEAVLIQMPAGVVVVDQAYKVLLCNDIATQLLPSLQRGEDLRAHLARCVIQHVDGTPYPELAWPVYGALSAGELASQEVFCTIAGARRTLRISGRPIVDGADRRIAAVMTFDDITDEHAAKDAAIRAAETREHMLAIVSHDLRGPLNSVSVAVEGLGDPALPPETRERYVGAVRRAVARADRLIGDLLDASRIEAGKLTVERRPVRVQWLLDQTTREHEMLAQQAGSKFEVQLGEGIDRIEADPDRLLQALANLVNNSLRHAKGSTIRLAASGDGNGKVRISVADDGPGIPADALPHVFDRFRQVGRQRRGTGLGLAIVKGIVDAHQGSITATSTVGAGTRFEIELPTGSA